MTATITEFRKTICDHLTATLNVTFHPGVFTEAQQQQIGCVFWDLTQEVEGRVADESTLLRVRWFKKQPRGRHRGAPPDPTSLEEAAVTLVDALAAITAGAGPWFFRVVSVEPDYTNWFIEALLVGNDSNRFDPGA